jgi:predicted RNase H-like nuclease (RuvC/YqgF family)
MASKPLDILKKGLIKLKNSFKAKKEQLEAKLSRQESISSSDERWLDNEANTVDEQRVIDTLESSSNYERGLEHLDEAGKVIVKKLREWGGDIAKAVGKKRKRTVFFFSK